MNYIGMTACMGKADCQNLNKNLKKKPSTFGSLGKQTKTTPTKKPSQKGFQLGFQMPLLFS